MLRSNLVLALALLGCADDGLHEALGPDIGKGDGGDAADRGCRVILRELDGLSKGRIDVAKSIIADGGRPSVLVTFDRQNFFELDDPSSTSGGLAGFQRFAFSIPVPSNASDERIEIIPFVKHNGGRLFDHNRHPNENYVAERATGHQIPLDEQTCPAQADAWGPIVSLRDDTSTFLTDKPVGGWWVTPIHATLLPSGKVLVTGWGRRDRESCFAGGSRRNGISYIIDPDDLTTSSLNVTPIDEDGNPSSDVLYCAGHTPIPDGRILYAGGSRYDGLGTPTQLEQGLDYARLFDPRTNTFRRITTPMTGGPAGSEGMRWYPSTTRLTDGRVLVTGGFTRCCGTEFTNRSIEVFDPAALDANVSPWSTLLTHEQGATEIGASIKDYPRVFSLPEPVPQQAASGVSRQVAVIGAAGRVMLLSTNPNVSAAQRFTSRSNARRPGNVGADDATSSMTSTGDLLVLGGTADGGAAQRADLYDPSTDRWRSIDTGISRYNAASVALPDGTTLIVNGDGGNDGDRRRPQVLDPRTDTIATMDPWTDDPNVRGYHSFALLLKDGRVLVGGGTNSEHGIGCERPDLRIYEPAYLNKGDRPVIAGTGTAPLTMAIGGGPVSLDVSGPPLAADGGAVLMALGSFTHGSDQNQRYVALTFDQTTPGSLSLHPPELASQAPPGDYMLFLVSAAGVPSVGKHVRIERANVPLCRVTFEVNGQQDLTSLGQDVHITGTIEELGKWSAAEGVKLSAPQYPRWQGTVNLPQGATIHYKAVVFDTATSGARFESGADRVATIPTGSGCAVSLPQDFRR
ncbi:MAG: hypothetical protein H6Q90_2197 [Deltaproteobacteria bacterium]|nr:hypothetical protein [Deltaproteobacteria bacterium]